MIIKKSYTHWVVTILITVIAVSLVGVAVWYEENNESISVTAADVINANISVSGQNANSNTNQENKSSRSEILSMVSAGSSCIPFIKNRTFIDPSDILYISDIKPLEELAKEWRFGDVCKSSDNGSVLVVSVTRPVIEGGANETEAFNQTKKLFTRLSEKEYYNSDESLYYYIFLYANYPTEVLYGNKKRTFEAGSLSLLADLVWSDALAGCMVEPGNYVVDQGVTIGCGGGDNGCAEIERVKWNLIDGKTTYLGTCTNNCDLRPGEPFVLECKP
jgi:hypothetical protein